MIDPYCGAAPLPAEWTSRWNFDPLLLAIMLGLGAVHAIALWRDNSDRRAGASAMAATGWLLLIALFVSPLCALTSALFSARVAHHAVLVAVVAPLLVLSLPRRWLALRIGSAAAGAAFVAHMILLWLWHAPAPYAAALADHGVFWAMEASLLGSAMLLWLAVLSPASSLTTSLALLLGTLAQTGLLGAVITFARAPLYIAHAGTTAPWGFGALADQQLAGLIMWVPAAIPYLVAALMLLGVRLGENAAADDPAR